MNPIVAPAVPWHPNDEDTLALIFSDLLGSRNISSVDSVQVAPATAGGLTHVGGSATPNLSEFVDADGNTVPVRNAALADFTGGNDGDDYWVTFVVTLDDGSKKGGVLPVYCRAFDNP